ncbi:hypothetical protein ACSSS7_007555 [Eimeria intestinalis]
MVAPAEIPQLVTPRRPSAVASVKHEDTSSSSSRRSSSKSSSRSLSEERPTAPSDRTSSYEDPGAPRGPPPYGSRTAAASRDLFSKTAAAAAAASGGDAVDSPRSLPERTSESWRQLAPGGGPPRGLPEAPPQGGGPSGLPLNIVVRPDSGPEEGSLYPPSRVSDGREPWRASGGGGWGPGPPSARGRGPSSFGASPRSPRASLGLPAVPQSPRGSVLLIKGGSGTGKAAGGGDTHQGPHIPQGGPKVDAEKCAADVGGGGPCMLQQAAAAGLRGVPCPNCRFVVPLQHIVLCAEWQIRHAMQASRPPPVPSESPLQGAPPGGMHLSPTSLLQQQPSKPSKLAAAAAGAAADTSGWGYRESQQQQQQQQRQQEYSGYEGPWRGPSVPLPWRAPTRPPSLGRGPPPEASPLGYSLGSGMNTRGPPMAGSVWGPVPPSFLSSPFNMHLWAA